MKNLIRWLVEAMNPCIHQWEKVDVVHDNPENPSVTQIIRMCSICGEINTVEIKSPQPPKDHCPPHVWETFHSIRVVANVEAKNPDTRGYRLMQRCTRCGETRTKNEGFAK